MKRTVDLLTMFSIILVVLSLATLCQAADQMLSGTVQEVIQKTDRNGAEYTRMILKVSKELSGLAYQDEVVVMGFQDKAPILATYAEGSEFTGVVGAREYEGNTYYTVKAFQRE